MTISLYNTLTRTKENFVTLEPNKVKMYCCGVTVYDYCHLGHARSYIAWDTIRRYLQWRGYDVNYIQNFTDIDDKILNRAREENSSMVAVAEKYIAAYYEDLRSLNVLDANQYPRVTEHIPAIHQLINDLITKGYAYPVEGDVYYRVRKFADYGKLSGRKFDDMEAGASGRMEEEPESQKKEDPFDFALWKGAKEGEPSWDSPWGKGRPGWHIECSAMIRSQLGQTIDIHCGGGDLVFPHHENEIAQSEGAHGQSLAKYWLHNGMVTVNGEKMSKSLGNFTTIRDLLKRNVSPMAVRLFVLTAQYRKPIDFNDESIKSAENSWQTIKEGLLFGYQYADQLDWSNSTAITPNQTNSAIASTETTNIENPLKSIDFKALIGEEIFSSFQKTFNQLILPFAKFPDYFNRFIQEYRQYVAIALLLYLSQFPIRIGLGFLNSINSLPLISEIFKVVGIVIVGRYLLYKSVREKTNQTWQNFFTKLIKNSTTINHSTPTDNPYIQRFQNAVDDDFNFPEGLAVIFELAKELRKEGNLLVHQGKTQSDPQALKKHWETLLTLTGVLGLKVDPKEANHHQEGGLSDAEIEGLIVSRKAARDNKDFAMSDRIRDELKAQGITLIDQPGGITTWHR